MKRLLLLALIAVPACGMAVRPAGAPPLAQPSCRTVHGSPGQVAWVLPESDRAELDAWCAAVGPAVFVAAADTEPPAAVEYSGAAGPAGGEGGPLPVGGERWAAIDSVLVVTWNVHVGGGDLDAFINDLRAGVLTGGGGVEHFVLLLQEAYRRSPALPAPAAGAQAAGRIAPAPPAGGRLPVELVARAHGLHLVYVPSMRNGSDAGPAAEDRGNAILSTLPLAAAVALELPAERQRRVALAAAIAGRTGSGSPWTLQVVSAHLENRVGATADGVIGMAGVAARARQMAWLLDHLPPADLAVLGGDLNTWVDEEDERAALAARARYPHTAPLPDGPTHVSFGVFRARLDYLFARVPAGAMRRYRRAPDAYGSDHFPLLAWIALPAGP